MSRTGKPSFGSHQSNNSAKKHHWMLSLVYESLLRNRIFTVKVSPHKMLANLKKLETLQWKNQQIPPKISDQNEQLVMEQPVYD